MARSLTAASLSFLLFLVATSHAMSSPQEEYWHKVLPSTPMPKAIKDVLNSDPRTNIAGVVVQGLPFSYNGGKTQVDGLPFSYNGGKTQVDGLPFSYNGGKTQVDGLPFSYNGGKTQVDGLPFSYNGGKTQVDGLPFSYNGGKAQVDGLPFSYNGGKTQVDGLPFSYNGGKTQVDGLPFSYNGGKAQVDGLPFSYNGGKAQVDGLPFSYNGGKAQVDGLPFSYNGGKEQVDGLPFSYNGGKTQVDGLPFSYNGGHTHSYDPSIIIFFQEKDLNPGTKMNLVFKRTSYKVNFLPRLEAEAVPFSSSRLPEILSHFSVDPKSTLAKSIMKTLAECELPAVVGEKKLCATSLESMVDFSVSSLGTNQVQAISTVLSKEENKPQLFTIAQNGIRKLPGNKLVSCHEEAYPYAVFYCHAAPARGYVVELVGEDGMKVKAAATCHTNTKAWNPDHLAFKVLKVKPGTVPICHFLPQDSIIWSHSN